MSDEHQPFIKTPKQLIAVIVLSFVIPIALIIMMVSYVGTSKRDGAGSGGLTEEAIAKRIAPVARFELVDASAPKTLATGEAVYNTQCAACHAAGVAGGLESDMVPDLSSGCPENEIPRGPLRSRPGHRR